MAGYQPGVANRIPNDGTWTYTYDDEGNTATRSKAGGEKWYYAWNNAKELTSVRQTSDGTTNLLWVTYTYDALGQKVPEDRGYASKFAQNIRQKESLQGSQCQERRHSDSWPCLTWRYSAARGLRRGGSPRSSRRRHSWPRGGTVHR